METYRIGLTHERENGDVVVEVHPIGNGMDTLLRELGGVIEAMTNGYNALNEAEQDVKSLNWAKHVHLEPRSNGAHNWVDVRFDNQLAEGGFAVRTPDTVAALLELSMQKLKPAFTLTDDAQPTSFLKKFDELRTAQAARQAAA